MTAKVQLPCGHASVMCEVLFARTWGVLEVPCNFKGQGYCAECGKQFTIEIKATEVKPTTKK